MRYASRIAPTQLLDDFDLVTLRIAPEISDTDQTVETLYESQSIVS
jgi:hypothetical protein